jgi:hypothetical protein
MRRWILRPVAWLLGIGAVVVALLAGAIRLDQYVLRRRAERLLSDIRSLELRKSTYADARRLEDRWLDESKEAVCRPSWCDLQISVDNVGARHLAFLLNHLTIRAIYHGLGGRVAGVGSFLRVRDNLLWGKGMGLAIETLSTESDGRNVEYDLEGSIGTDDHFTWVSARHPEYQIGGPTACTSCREGWVKFTPYAAPQDVLRLTDLNFACLTRWRHCTEPADILPTAWREMRAEAAKAAQNGRESCTLPMIRVLSRQSHHVDLVKVIKLELEPAVPSMTVRRMSRVPFQLENWWAEFPLVVDASDNIHVGDRLLLLEDGWCQTVPATAENMTAAQLGAGEGWVSPAHSVGLPFDTFKPPKIDVH